MQEVVNLLISGQAKIIPAHIEYLTALHALGAHGICQKTRVTAGVFRAESVIKDLAA